MIHNFYFLHQVKHNKANGTWDKGIVVKDQSDVTGNLEAAKQSYHAYLGAYAYGNNADTDYVYCLITDEHGNHVEEEKWSAQEDVQPEPEE